MKLKQLTKEDAKNLETNSRNVGNFLTYELHEKLKNILYLEKGLQGWYREYNISAGSFKAKIPKLTEIFNTKPNFYVNYLSRYAVWGFEWQDQKFLIYVSKRGLTIQIAYNFDLSLLEQFLLELRDQLYSSK